MIIIACMRICYLHTKRLVVVPVGIISTHAQCPSGCSVLERHRTIVFVVTDYDNDSTASKGEWK